MYERALFYDSSNPDIYYNVCNMKLLKNNTMIVIETDVKLFFNLAGSSLLGAREAFPSPGVFGQGPRL